MPQQVDEIFLINREELQSLPYRSMRQGLWGVSLEDALQTLLQNYPQLIPGNQLDPVREDPLRFVLLRREMPVGSWSLDHLYVDQDAVLTLVETKLLQNPESRREVIGQIIEYAANSGHLWASGRARQYATEFWSKRDQDLDQILLQTFGQELDVEGFWTEVEENLKQGRIRLIIAADELRPEVRQMIEFLNKEMQNTQLLGLELRCYGLDDTQLVLVPRLVGQTETIRHNREKQQKTTENIFLSLLSPEVSSFFERIFEQTRSRRMVEVFWGTKGFSLRLKLPTGKVSVLYGYPPGSHGRDQTLLWVEARYFEDENQREELRRKYRSVPGVRDYGAYGAELALTPETLVAAETLVQIIWELVDRFQPVNDQ